MKGDLGVLFIEALEGLAYRYDGQVARLIVEKVYGPEPETTITIKPLTADGTSSWGLTKGQTYLEDEDQLSDTDKLAAAIMAAGQDIRGGPYAVANAMILHGTSLVSRSRMDPSRTPRASRKLSKRRAGTTCKPANAGQGRVGMAGFFDRDRGAPLPCQRGSQGAIMFKRRAAGQRIFPSEPAAPSLPRPVPEGQAAPSMAPALDDFGQPFKSVGGALLRQVRLSLSSAIHQALMTSPIWPRSSGWIAL